MIKQTSLLSNAAWRNVFCAELFANLRKWQEEETKTIKMHFEEPFQLYTLRYFNGCLWNKYVFSFVQRLLSLPTSIEARLTCDSWQAERVCGQKV